MKIYLASDIGWMKCIIGKYEVPTGIKKPGSSRKGIGVYSIQHRKWITWHRWHEVCPPLYAPCYFGTYSHSCSTWTDRWSIGRETGYSWRSQFLQKIYHWASLAYCRRAAVSWPNAQSCSRVLCRWQLLGDDNSSADSTSARRHI